VQQDTVNAETQVLQSNQNSKQEIIDFEGPPFLKLCFQGFCAGLRTKPEKGRGKITPKSSSVDTLWQQEMGGCQWMMRL
jgi:hypothetical protein